MLVIFDGDGTLWEGDLIAGYLTLPLKLIDDLTVEDFVGKRVRLKNDVREILTELKKRGVYVALASQNSSIPVESFLRKLKLHGYFNFLKVSFDAKDEMVAGLLEEFKKQKKDPSPVFYVDDDDYNFVLIGENMSLQEVKCINAKQLGSIKEILRLIGE